MASIAIIGSGFVGQSVGKTLSRQGHRVLFVDIDNRKLSLLAKEGFYVSRPEVLEDQADVYFITVPTPTIDGTIQLSFIEAAATMLGSGPLRHTRIYPVVIVKSTVPPGTTRRLIIPLLEHYSGKKAGEDFGVAMEPEYLREKTALEDAGSPRMVLIGSDHELAAKVLEWLRIPFRRPIAHLSPEEAEMQQYVHNLYNAAKISFFNEMREVCETLGIEADKIFSLVGETAEASWNRQYGLRDLGPFGGSCLPKDTLGFLSWSKTQLSLDLPLTSAVLAVNEHVIEKQRRAKPSMLSDAIQTVALPSPATASFFVEPDFCEWKPTSDISVDWSGYEK